MDEHPELDPVRALVTAFVVETRREIAEAERQADGLAATGLAKGMLSLIIDAEDGQPMFYRWTYPERLMGRQISIDALGRVKTIVARRVPELQKMGARIIIADTGSEMEKRRPAHRPPMSKFAMKLWLWYRAQHYPGPLALSDGWDTFERKCVFCTLRAGTLEDVRGIAPEEDNDRFACIECSCTWHEHCARLHRAPGFSAESRCPVCLELGLGQPAVS